MLIEKMYEWKIALLPGLHSKILTGSVEYWLNLMLNSFWEFSEILIYKDSQYFFLKNYFHSYLVKFPTIKMEASVRSV